MIRFDSNSGALELNGTVEHLLAETTFLVLRVVRSIETHCKNLTSDDILDKMHEICKMLAQSSKAKKLLDDSMMSISVDKNEILKQILHDDDN